MVQSAPVLELIDITRRFPGVVALADVSFDLRAGEVHALVGENGAGKSTLINLISGVLAPDRGSIFLRSQPTKLRDPVMARRLGIVSVHQEAELVPTLSVAENLALGFGLPTRAGLIDWRSIHREAEHVTAELGEPIPTGVEAARLSIGQRQMLHVAAAVLHKAAVVVLDEPTSALSAKETDWLFERITQLKQAGTGIIYVSHRQDEIFALADRVTVLRDGRRVWSGPTADVDSQRLIELMVGREYATTARQPSRQREAAMPPRLQVTQLAARDGSVRGVDLSVSAGEIVGLYGLMGAGRTEAARTIFGLQAASGGTVQVDGVRIALGVPGKAVRAGIVYVPEDRLRQGVFRGLSVRTNAVICSLPRWSRFSLVSAHAERRATAGVVDRLDVRLQSIEQPLGTLSGGNQQKIVLGRWLLVRPKVLLLDEPTRGVDVAAKQELHTLLRREASDGAAIVLISSELPELFAHADRIIVLRSGRVAGEFDPRSATPAEVAVAAFPDVEDGQPKPVAGSVEPKQRLGSFVSELGIWAAILVLGLLLAATHANFLSLANLLTVLGNVSTTAILALAAACVIVAGGIDISIGALFALAAAAGGLVLQREGPPSVVVPAGIATGLAVGLGGGLLNASLTLVGRIHPIVVTLGMATVYRGLLVILTAGETIGDLPPTFGSLVTSRKLGLSGAIWVLIVVIVAVQLVWRYTRAGRHLFAVGSSPGAARLVGISQARAWMFAFGGGGLLVGLAAMLELARNGSMQSGMGTGMELRAIAAAVIGGTAITGGRANVGGVVAGALLLGLVSNALVMWQVSGFHYDVVIGSLLLAAVIGDRVWRVRR